MNISTRLRELREKRKWSVNRLERESEISRQVLSGWEKGVNQEFIEKLDKVCKALGITLADFFLE